MSRNAVLIFADRTSADLARRRWPRRLAALLPLPHLDGDGAWDVHLFTPGGGGGPAGVSVHKQTGRGFGERLERAVQTLESAGYDRVVIVGRDCPALERGDIAQAFAALDANRVALGPDQHGGCWLIGLRLRDRDLLQGVRWCRGEDFAALLAKAGGAAAVLGRKIDLDSTADALLLARQGRRWFGVVASLLFPDEVKRSADAPPPSVASRRRRLRFQTPPPRGRSMRPTHPSRYSTRPPAGG